jgi:hypothetical protein
MAVPVVMLLVLCLSIGSGWVGGAVRAMEMTVRNLQTEPSSQQLLTQLLGRKVGLQKFLQGDLFRRYSPWCTP